MIGVDVPFYWPDDVGVDRLLHSDLAQPHLSAESWTLLTTVGLPKTLILTEWLGPTLFTSSLGMGGLTSFTPDLADSEMVDLLAHDLAQLGQPYVLGTMQEQRPGGDVLRVYCLVPGREQVIAIELHPTAYVSHYRRATRFVNSSLQQFTRCMQFLYTAWPTWISLVNSPSPSFARRRRFVYSYVNRGLRHRDPECFIDPSSAWPSLSQEAFDEFLF